MVAVCLIRFLMRVSAVAKRILIVDDNRDLACAMSMMLTMCGFDTAMAYSGASALLTARDFRPQVALLDIGLPDMNGCDLARDLRKSLAPARPFLIAISAVDPRDSNSAETREQFDLYLLKPVDPDRLLSLLSAS